MVDRLIAVVPGSLAERERLRFQEAVRKAQVLNLHSEAARRLLNAMGIGRAPVEFARQADVQIRKHCDHAEHPVELGAAGIGMARVFSYAEYCIVDAAGGGRRAEGRLLRESGLSPEVNGRRPRRPAAPWLQAFRLPLSGHVDRWLCAEFQLLEELCGILVPGDCQPTTHPEVVGVVSLFTTTTPCMSCIGAVRQFQLLFPEVAIEMTELDLADSASAPSGARQ